MESVKKKDKVILELINEEAIVLLDWLCRFNNTEKQGQFQDQAEERVLWDLEASLESVITESFNSNYAEILDKARGKIRD